MSEIHNPSLIYALLVIKAESIKLIKPEFLKLSAVKQTEILHISYKNTFHNICKMITKKDI